MSAARGRKKAREWKGLLVRCAPREFHCLGCANVTDGPIEEIHIREVLPLPRKPKPPKRKK